MGTKVMTGWGQAGFAAADLKNLGPGSNTVAIGARLAESLGARVGDTLSAWSTSQGQTTPFGTVPRIIAYKIVAIFEVGIYDYDKAFVVMPMADAQTLLMLGSAVGMIEVTTVDPGQGRRTSSGRSPTRCGRSR